MQGGIVCGACGEVVEVVGTGEPDGLGLEGCGCEDKARLVEGCEGGVAVAAVECAPGPVVGGEFGGEGKLDGCGVLQESIGQVGEVHIVLVGGSDEGVAAFIGWPAGGEVSALVADGGEEEAEVAFFVFLVAGDDVVGSGADEREGFTEGGP